MRHILFLSLTMLALNACQPPAPEDKICELSITVPNVNTPTSVQQVVWMMEDGTTGSTCRVMMRGIGTEATAFRPEGRGSVCVLMRNPTRNEENTGTWTFEMAQDGGSTRLTLDQGRPYAPLVWDIPCTPIQY